MEGKVRSRALHGLRLFLSALLVAPLLSRPPVVAAQEQSAVKDQEEVAQLRLRKTPLTTREYQGKAVEGEERVVSPGDSLWKILIQEKGLSVRRFGRYLVIIGALNPHIKKPDILLVGDTIFVPTRPDEILGIQLASGKGETRIHRVKRGDYLYKILREQFGVQEWGELRGLFDQVKELNPGKKNWDTLLAGETILLPQKGPVAVAREPEKPVEIVAPDYARILPLERNLHIFEQVMSAAGNETRRDGEEVVPVQEGIVRIARDTFPVIHNPRSDRKVILDPAGKIPPSLRKKIEGQNSAMPVVSLKKDASLHEAVSNLLSRMGFQLLPANRPVVIQDKGVGIQVQGEWMVAATDESGGPHEIIVIGLVSPDGRTPDYLKDYLSLRGMNLKEILLPAPRLSPASISRESPIAKPAAEARIESLPAEKRAMVDTLLKERGIPFSSAKYLSVRLRDGIRLETEADRFFEAGGKRVALFFRAVGEDVRKALEERDGIRAVEMDLESLGSQALLTRFFDAVGEPASYGEHRFRAQEKGTKDRLVITIAGFYLRDRSLLLTDWEVPKDLQRFFAERGVRIVYFQ